MRHSERRRFLARAALGLASATLLAKRSWAQAAALDPAIRAITKGAPVYKGRVRLELPALADNGNSVPLKVSVDGAQSSAGYVRSIHLISEKNPVRNMATYYLSPRSGRAEVATRVRLAGSQTITAVVELSDGGFWMDSASTVVTSSACLDES